LERAQRSMNKFGGLLMKRCTLAGMALGIILGLIGAPVFGALLGLVFGAPWFTEPGPWVAPGPEGAGFGALVYGVLGCIPTALVGAIVGGVVAARRDAGGRGNAEQLAPADRPRE
jgi:hypothetical protein